jgi:hypothetical protein
MVEGWTYAVSTEKDRFEGMFKGYAMIGSESAIAMQLSGGVTRFVPVANIMYIDLTASGGHKEEKKAEPAYYG